MDLTREYVVEGMSCEHCVASVTEEVEAVPGVTRVDVELETGRLTVTGDADPAQVRAAVDEAGYALAV